jgi:hypothetical protein
MLGGGALGLLIVATAIALFQPHRITTRPARQALVRGVGIVLLALTAVTAWISLQQLFHH